MDFSLSEEQLLLKEAIGKFVQNEYSFERRREIVAQGYSEAVWQQFAELGWLSVPFAEEHGGLGGNLCDLAVVMEELGKGLVVEPYLASVLLGGQIVAELGSEAQRDEILPALVAGQVKLALAFTEPESRYQLSDVQCRATRSGDGWQLDGRKAVVLHGAEADRLVVIARSAGQRRDCDGLSAFLVARDSAGLTASGYPTVDGLRAAELQLDAVRVDASALLGRAGDAYTSLNRTVNRAALALCAEAVGIMDLLLDKTLDYTRTRAQFGQPIARFQALQHRMADMFMECQQARSILLMALLKADAEQDDLDRLASAAKARIGSAARKVGQESVQLHGGIGVTEDLDVGHYFKRLTMIGQLFGSTDFHLARYAERSCAARP